MLEPEFGGVPQALNRDSDKLSVVIRHAWEAGAILEALRGAPSGMSYREISSMVCCSNKPGYYMVAKQALLLKMRLARVERVATGDRPAEA